MGETKHQLLQVRDERSFIIAGAKFSEAEARQLWAELSDALCPGYRVPRLLNVADAARRYTTSDGYSNGDLKAALKELDG